ncbi:hypothetical protein VIA_001714 [Vibrio orientalis CIP 102891 = ATCC 33934]|uniref:Uncharacterized protein n=1 Tax=Vibrio orientalis CIP 102891 = ATCC 33934 TaxID=675816 RepID=A0ABM9Z4I2_VIBOR|nr:hypothetical protein VIA_001714 [Vibrio orientalis CIP 102891 = ATCC 33934]
MRRCCSGLVAPSPLIPLNKTQYKPWWMTERVLSKIARPTAQ